jgi:lysophospholipase
MSRQTEDSYPWRSLPGGARFSGWMAPDGASLRRMDWRQSGRRKARGELLFAAGRGDFIEKYLETFAHWHAAGWNVTSFDWRGQGRSQAGGRLDLDSFKPLIADLAALIADWRGDTNGPHFAIGHSMGGHLLLKTIVEKRPALDAAVLIAPMIRVNSAPIPQWLAPDVVDTMCRLGLRTRQMWKTPPAFSRVGSQRQHNLTESVPRYEDELYWWEQAPEYNLGAPTWGWTRTAFRSADESFTPRKLAAVDLPILILGAERDRLVSADAIKRAAAALPRAELRMFADAAHEILRDADPIRDDALARIDAFFAGHSP